ncbi:hypothetical protein HBH56_203930 [Parastagonospora nodorum]|uniref:CENP-V/GFA domain-containing protein n=1 Tax=Phaeosphaeria nodorum (strain SN15 / ATCC MYA-4574 / FGSC 10173) TaxID=321614 RepID=A0A7U2I6X4_PHANO|nr:hypothetical protein HBH56_203930 [Parastagonospora nodorum]QRD01713.1 hypothetical protein JI435_145460 [Parastagonospora nodorum SN15]KAH3923935.1 hypothetical protein HBH54_202800 [Parastagonospora nodorum]KAH4013754.1 hypothetical protein HBI09_213490 [Parastagonospora nodorum]KAH4042781.1 hypothetical protein HBH49_242690 [Parastagonospora nodorum]
MPALAPPFYGSCPCTHISYTLTSTPLIVHACHCTHCQHESGSAFALNALYEPDRVIVQDGKEADILRTNVPSEKGGQTMHRCPKCYTVLWSTYAAGRDLLKVVRVGTIDGGVGKLRPDAHLFVGKEKGWMNLDGERVFETVGKKENYWSGESLERFRIVVGRGQR